MPGFRKANKQTNQPVNDQSDASLRIPLLFSKMHERKIVLLNFIQSAVWEFHLGRKPCVVGKCFILFQTDGGNIAVPAI